MSSDASSTPAPLSIQQVVAKLPLREYCQLCDLVDQAFGKTVTELSNAGGTTPKTAQRKTVVKFDVLAIDRLENQEILVTVLVGDNKTARMTIK